MKPEEMDMRDLFALYAMQGLLANPEPSEMTYGQLATQSYIMADLMLKAREGKVPK
jgi:hypothetical protein